jgi:hypothetical protein
MFLFLIAFGVALVFAIPVLLILWLLTWLFHQ